MKNIAELILFIISMFCFYNLGYTHAVNKCIEDLDKLQKEIMAMMEEGDPSS